MNSQIKGQQIILLLNLDRNLKTISRKKIWHYLNFRLAPPLQSLNLKTDGSLYLKLFNKIQMFAIMSGIEYNFCILCWQAIHKIRSWCCTGISPIQTTQHTSSLTPRVVSSFCLYFSILDAKSLYRLSTAALHWTMELACRLPLATKPSANERRSFTLSFVSWNINDSHSYMCLEHLSAP